MALSFFCLLRGQDICCASSQYAPFAAILSPFAFAGWSACLRLRSHSLLHENAGRRAHSEKLKTVTFGNERIQGIP
jgi:hypothetical protein